MVLNINEDTVLQLVSQGPIIGATSENEQKQSLYLVGGPACRLFKHRVRPQGSEMRYRLLISDWQHI